MRTELDVFVSTIFERFLGSYGLNVNAVTAIVNKKLEMNAGYDTRETNVLMHQWFEPLGAALSVLYERECIFEYASFIVRHTKNLDGNGALSLFKAIERGWVNSTNPEYIEGFKDLGEVIALLVIQDIAIEQYSGDRTKAIERLLNLA